MAERSGVWREVRARRMTRSDTSVDETEAVYHTSQARVGGTDARKSSTYRRRPEDAGHDDPCSMAALARLGAVTGKIGEIVVL